MEVQNSLLAAERNRIRNRAFAGGFGIAAIPFLGFMAFLNGNEFAMNGIHPLGVDTATNYVKNYQFAHVKGPTSFLVKTDELLELLAVSAASPKTPKYIHIFYGRQKFGARKTLIISGAKDTVINVGKSNETIYINTYLPNTIAHPTPSVLEHVIPCYDQKCILTTINPINKAVKETELKTRKYPDNLK